MGLKSDRNTLGVIEDLNKVLGYSKPIIPEAFDEKVGNRFFHNSESKSDIQRLKREKKSLITKVLKNDFISFEIEVESKKSSDQFCLNLDEMISSEAKIIEMTKTFNKRLDENPNDLLLWIEYLKFQDRHHAVMIGKISSAVLIAYLMIYNFIFS